MENRPKNYVAPAPTIHVSSIHSTPKNVPLSSNLWSRPSWKSAHQCIINYVNLDAFRVLACYALLIFLLGDLFWFTYYETINNDHKIIWMTVLVFIISIGTLWSLHFSILLVLSVKNIFSTSTPSIIPTYITLSFLIFDSYSNIKFPEIQQKIVFYLSSFITCIHVAFEQLEIHFMGFYSSYVFVMLTSYFVMREEKWLCIRNAIIQGPRNR